jgi:transcriptional regulator with XRE-family HTH domain
MSTTNEQSHPGGRLLARYRNRQDLGQQDLAEMAHCSRSMIAQIEAGDRLPSGELLSAMSNALNLGTVERATLFCLYSKVEPNQSSMLPYVIATLRLDPLLQSEQIEALISLITQEYEKALRANGSLSTDRAMAGK